MVRPREATLDLLAQTNGAGEAVDSTNRGASIVKEERRGDPRIRLGVGRASLMTCKVAWEEREK